MTVGAVTYVFLIAADHEMYAVKPGWRLFAVDLATGATYEMAGGFTTEGGAIACRDGAIATGMSPANDPALFCRLSLDARMVAFISDPNRKQ
jgi:hypothetical protein